MHLTLCSCPARGYLACSLEPPGVKLPTSRVLTGARSTSWAVRVKGWRWDSGAGRQLQPSAVCTDWETPPASLWSHRVCALCVSMLLCYSDELLRLWWLNKLLSSWRIPSTLCTTYWTVWQVTLLPDTLQRTHRLHPPVRRLNLNSRTELKPFALLLNCSCQVQIVVQFQSDTKICWWL